MTVRPVLGVTCCNRLVGGEAAQSVINRYVAAAMRFADVAALLVPALPDLMSAREVAPRLDGLLLTGSPSNVEPYRYGQPEAAAEAGPYDPGRDAMSADLIAAMIDLRRPVTGVCLGFEEINVAFGGTLRRDAAAGALPHHAPDGADLEALFAHQHEVELAPGGVLARAFHADRLKVNSVHYQAIDRLADGLTVEARAPDGLVEAFSARFNDAPVLAVQWHPEWDAADNPHSRAFFTLLGKTLRGEA
jgi:putative glutamine amidotransferase